MSRPTPFILAAGLIAACILVPAPQALAHGEQDQQQLAEFHNHLDHYRSEVEQLASEVDSIVDAYGARQDTEAEITALIEHWEAVGVHAAIETRATVTYPGIWQALIALQQAAAGGQPATAVQAAGENIEAALWQGLGAVRLAASQLDSQPAASSQSARMSASDTVQQIIADLDQAVEAYQADDLQRAEALIHDTYMSRFEGLEGELIEHDPDLVSQLEKDFNATLPLLLQAGAPLGQVRAQLDQMRTQLETASQILQQAEKSRSEVF